MGKEMGRWELGIYIKGSKKICASQQKMGVQQTFIKWEKIIAHVCSYANGTAKWKDSMMGLGENCWSNVLE